ncbi:MULTISPECIES: hypothetical protein [Paenarthrobacter]|uniref:Uncharacterized protein n=1 Tax=Paenarthrobacter ureafaciens TaxID=37931 RepID=A0AAX3EI74_PAEUR|nr:MULTISPECIES: hypothetical protein [Paenarthrobacter]MDO5866014.1 hypothetical protein [Paenarthrobacter sp. SD-2]MDO5877110.1 hypothetical protein [Paenarthrobacter sp. SD-1]UYV92312.1 hypothetical protein NL395_17585 [Paenarthrobacter ureafaciens]UYV96847.1 hypothetical protein NL394_17615 [Paenarthrobacter ureafaciens]
MTGQKVTENGHVTAVRWGIATDGGVYVYETESIARFQHGLAAMDVPATLVMDDGNGWMVTE